MVLLTPLAVCMALVSLAWDERVPLEQVQCVQVACGSLVVKQYFLIYRLRMEHPALQPTA